MVIEATEDNLQHPVQLMQCEPVWHANEAPDRWSNFCHYYSQLELLWRARLRAPMLRLRSYVGAGSRHGRSGRENHRRAGTRRGVTRHFPRVRCVARLGRISRLTFSDGNDVRILFAPTICFHNAMHQARCDIPALAALRYDCYGFPVVPREYANEHGPAFRLKRDAVADSEVEHARVGARLMQESQAFDDAVVEIDQFLFGEAVDVDAHSDSAPWARRFLCGPTTKLAGARLLRVRLSALLSGNWHGDRLARPE